MAPMAFTNLAAPLRNGISITDASEEAGGAAESSNFIRNFDPISANRTIDQTANVIESSDVQPSVSARKC